MIMVRKNTKATMKSTAKMDLLGIGLYTPAEAAFYARVSTQKLNRWFYGNAQGERVTTPRFTNERTISFLDFVQAIAIRNIRINYNVPLPKIREGIDRAMKDHSIDYPLARERTIYLFGKELFILQKDEEFQKITGSNREQKMITKVVELYMEDLGFDALGLANQYNSFTWKGRSIFMRPQFRLGEPIVDSCKYSARTLWEGCITEGGFDQAAKVYGVEKEDIEIAYRYYDYLKGSNAA